MKSLLALLDVLHSESEALCPTIDRTRDISYIRMRSEHEGVSFLTITLPTFCDDFDKSLAEGRVSPAMFLSFKKRGAFPSLFSGLLRNVFTTKGNLLEEPCIESIKLVRQLSRLYKKVEIPCSPERVTSAFERFTEIELELKSLEFSEEKVKYLQFASILLSGPCNAVTTAVTNYSVKPHHGPGALAIPRSQNAKWHLDTWSDDLQDLFPHDHYGLPSVNAIEAIEKVKFDSPGTVTPVRVVAVPKTLKTPRIIAIEPLHKQFMQQGLKDILYDSIESDPILGGQINFTDQSINRNLAKESSSNGLNATIDLSEASDRVSNKLVEALFANYATFHGSINAVRTSHASVPTSTDILVLHKYASMGSALCFPIEAMAFYCIAVAAIVHHRALPLTLRNLRSVGKEVYVYGDDIIIPTNEVGVVNDWLESFGLKVNTSKSFWTGRFRESCGGDYYDGEWVTPIYCRRLSPVNKRTTSEVISWVSLANQFYESGYWRASRHVRRTVERAIGMKLPIVSKDFSGLGWTSFSTSIQMENKTKFCKRLHKPLVKTLLVRPLKQKDVLDGYPALHKFFSKKGNKPIFGDHLRSSVRRHCVALSNGWASLVK